MFDVCECLNLWRDFFRQSFVVRLNIAPAAGAGSCDDREISFFVMIEVSGHDRRAVV